MVLVPRGTLTQRWPGKSAPVAFLTMTRCDRLMFTARERERERKKKERKRERKKERKKERKIDREEERERERESVCMCLWSIVTLFHDLLTSLSCLLFFPCSLVPPRTSTISKTLNVEKYVSIAFPNPAPPRGLFVYHLSILLLMTTSLEHRTLLTPTHDYHFRILLYSP